MRTFNLSSRNVVLALTGAAFLLAGCETVDTSNGVKTSSKTKSGALIGAGAGAVLGALSNKNDRRKNAVIGAGIGALAGAGVGAYMDRQSKDLRAQLESRGVYVTRQGDNIILNLPSDVTFSTGSADIAGSFLPVLDDVATILNQYPSTYIDVVGHADSQGSDAFNLDLSERRANATAGYLVARKVKSERIYVAGMGETRPIASNDTAEGRAKNRRVEITLRPVE
ncbi:OmpA family protein [Asticcacaulis benevestitus]|uniref:Cell envelope biogenesis protein OmpA n=1 Tax=Asticcacaulis benevestitus DSM 16100 = ATCC BAA-896 TaxID=1121022 RepID=V4PHL3_9CAUL|nr:OmpA family protein [Asticcacaulis benevestitus]ESQ93437.1 cell envelope biogenesis protein OmpA [Asticcacaulis benevestitus DSM 16100 = ATCC BAA-896]